VKRFVGFDVGLIQDAPVECHDFQVGVLMNRVECEKQMHYGISVVK
jgi:hypothetical protein